MWHLVWWIYATKVIACRAIGMEYVCQFNILHNQPNGSDSLTESIRWVSITCLVASHLLGFSRWVSISISFARSLALPSSIQYWVKFTNSMFGNMILSVVLFPWFFALFFSLLFLQCHQNYLLYDVCSPCGSACKNLFSVL